MKPGAASAASLRIRAAISNARPAAHKAGPWDRSHALADSQVAVVERSFTSALQNLKDSVDLTELEGYLRRHDVMGAQSLFRFTTYFAQPWEQRLVELLVPLMLSTALLAVEDIKRGIGQKAIRGTPQPDLSAVFGVKNELALRFARRHAAERVSQVTDDMRRAIRAEIVRGLDEGIGPRATARAIRERGLGLTARLQNAVWKYEARLRAQGLPPDKVQRMTDRYYRKLLKYRSESIARTETIRAAQMGEQLQWSYAVELGAVPEIAIRRIWRNTRDERLCPICADMEGQEVGLYEEFGAAMPDGSVTYVLTPPVHPMCRCAVQTRIDENLVEFAQLLREDTSNVRVE